MQIEEGTVLIRGCEFRQAKPQIALGETVRRAVITDEEHRFLIRVSAKYRNKPRARE